MTRGRLWKPLFAVLCGLCCAAVAPALAAAAEPGSIQGTVTEAGTTPTPVEGAQVCAEEAGGGSGGCALTDALGDYSIENLPAGEYKVLFTGQACEEIEFEPGEFEQDCVAEWAEQYWQDIVPGNPPTLVEVKEEEATEDIDAELEALGELGGTITSPEGPIANSLVCVDGVNVYHPTCALTDSAGEYTVGELPPPEYFIEFTGLVCRGQASECLSESECLEMHACTRSYVAQYSFNFPTFEPEELNAVTVESRKRTGGVDATLVPAGTIKGRLTVAALGDPPAAGASVCVSSDESLRGECVPVEANGDWEVHGLASGSWYVQFRSPCTQEVSETCVSEPFLEEFYDGQTEEENATHLQVTAPETVAGIDASLQLKDATTPAFTANPVVTGNPYVGETLSCSAGTWANYPTAISYSWKRDVTTLPGQTGDTLTVTNADKNESLTCEVTIENGAGEVSATSNAVTVVRTPAPAFSADPVLSGSAEVGSTLTCSPGTWAGPQATAAYGWRRGGTLIAGETGNTYVVTSADEGASLTCQVTVENEAGSATAASNALSVPVKQSNNGGGNDGNSSNGNSPPATNPPSSGATTPPPSPEKVSPKTGSAVATGNATVKGGKAMVALKCTGGASCKGSLKLVYEAKAKNGKGKTVVTKVTIGSASFSLAKGAEKTIVVKLNSKGTAYVEEAGKKGLKVKLTGSGVKPRTVQLKLAVA